MKTFEKFLNPVKDKLGVKINRNEYVIIIYKFAKCYLETGTIIDIDDQGDCLVQLDQDEKETMTLYCTNLIKVEKIICIDTGEVHYTPFNSLLDLMSIGMVKYEFNKKFYYYHQYNSKGIEEYFIK